MLKMRSKRAIYESRAVLIGGVYLGVLILMIKLPGYLPYIITAEKYGPAKSVLLFEYWSNLCLMAWLILGPILAVVYCILWHRKKQNK